MTVLRSALFNLLFFALTFVLTVAASVLRLFGAGAVLAVGGLWSRVLLWAARVLCGIRLEVSGLEQLPAGGVIIASRHQSAFDTFVWFSLLPRCCYVLKHELLRIPVFGGLIRSTGMIAINRESGATALRVLLREGERAAREGRQIVIFPEGTRGEVGQPRPVQAGVAALAAKTGLPVVPVATDSGVCWGRRAFRKHPGTIHIVIGRPVSAGTGRENLLRMLQQEMSVLDRQIVAEKTRVSAVDNPV